MAGRLIPGKLGEEFLLNGRAVGRGLACAASPDERGGHVVGRAAREIEGECVDGDRPTQEGEQGEPDAARPPLDIPRYKMVC